VTSFEWIVQRDWHRSTVSAIGTRSSQWNRRLNKVLEKAGFDRFCEDRCAGFYHVKLGRPSLAPGLYFRIMMIGFFEGLDSERGIAWRMADSLALRQFLSIGLDENTPDHVTISRTRRLIGGETHQFIFTWVLEQLAQEGLIQGQDHWGGFDHAGSQCGDEVDRQARYGREL
jgi:transposase